jgi:hypothetical protein
MAPAAQYLDVQHVESCERPGAFREDMRDIEDVIRGSIAAHHAPFTVSFHAGDLEESVQVIYLLLAGAFLGDRFAAGQPVFFFGSL